MANYDLKKKDPMAKSVEGVMGVVMLMAFLELIANMFKTTPAPPHTPLFAAGDYIELRPAGIEGLGVIVTPLDGISLPYIVQVVAPGDAPTYGTYRIIPFRDSPNFMPTPVDCSVLFIDTYYVLSTPRG